MGIAVNIEGLWNQLWEADFSCRARNTRVIMSEEPVRAEAVEEVLDSILDGATDCQRQF